MTLVELLVVLTILIVLTTVAFVATDQFLEQARYDVTTRTLQNISDGLVGPSNLRDADGAPQISGFLVDIGRMPLPLDGDPLKELWSPTLPAGLVAYGPPLTPADPRRSTDDPEISFVAGWRGPYVRLPVGAPTGLQDGWARDFSVASTASSIRVVSKGADGQDGGTGYNADIAFDSSTLPLATSGITGQIQVKGSDGTLANLPPSTELTVVLFRFNGSAVVPTRVDMTTNADGMAPYSFTNVPMGFVAIRAYQVAAAAPLSTATKKTPITSIIMVPGVTNLKNLVFPS